MQVSEIFEVILNKISGMVGVIFTATAMVLIKIVFVGQQGSILMKIGKLIAGALSGMLMGYFVNALGFGVAVCCMATALTTLVAEKLVRLISDEGPDEVFNALKLLLKAFIERISPKNNKGDDGK